ncbi:transcriptional regulator ATRX homolog [Papilio machaon]|uniref:transcriptional regulator ATRX homolog n=1 Tax=Papilio machaon TaxID=76193 RepID=UPI001E663D88|nr:transcriptional regulator ATRX homolog [Papilio machaon]
MECENDGFGDFEAAANGGVGIERERHGGARELQLDVAAAVPTAPDQKSLRLGMEPAQENGYWKLKPSDNPFMNNMEEISYWVHTKRAPCLYTYDKTNNKPKEQAHCSKYNSKIKAVKEVPSPRKKNKRKLVLIDQDSVSTEKEQSAFYFTTDTQLQVAKTNVKASSNGSDEDFVVKKSSTAVKPKRMRLQKKNKMDFEKKNKMVTSTPKVTALRRSLRKLQKSLNDNQLDSTIKVINKTLPLEPLPTSQISPENQAPKIPEDETKTIAHDVTMEEQPSNNSNEKSKVGVLNGKLEDVSDVSGFTANYIRSTKTHLTKTPRNMRSKLNRTFIKESQESPQKQESKTVVCVNKSVNTGPQDSAILNYSTDSSQNVINLVTSKQNSKVTRVSRSTSLLKFMNPKQTDNKQAECSDKEVSNVNETVHSNGTSRYPKRQRNCNPEGKSPIKVNNSRSATDRRKRMCKKQSEFTNSDRKENSEEEIVSRTRSGRKINQRAGQTDNSVLVLSNSTEQLSSMAAVNVAGTTESHILDNSTKKKRQSGRCTQLKKSAGENRQLLKRDSRDKSGFTACFSDSDDDFESKQRKFFC